MKKSLLLIFTFLAFVNIGWSQDFSNKGKDFWVGYGYHAVMISGNQQEMVLYFTSDVTANVRVDIPAISWTRSYIVTANTVVTSANMPKIAGQDARLLTEGTYNTGIHITSDKPIVAYAHIYNSSVSGATLLFPTNTLGQDYYSLNYKQVSNVASANSWSYVIATEDNTLVEITPSAATLSHAANVPFTVTLNKGEIYNLMGTTTGTNGVDLTGTRIRSISTSTSGCKRIAVFSGSGRLSITCNTQFSSSDNLIQQVFPKNAWGRRYLTVPTANLPNNFYRIAVSVPGTVVTVNGVVLTGLINNFYYDLPISNTPKLIVSDEPIMVAQYITSAGACNNNFGGNGDPEMIYLSPVEQTISDITLNSTSSFLITSHYINVVLKSTGVNSFKLDGISRAASFTAHPSDNNYSYATFTVAAGAHNLRSDSGFNAIAYGYGNAESYGYNAGTNIKDLYQFVSFQNQYATVNFPATCKDAPFKFSITLPYQPISLVWNFNNDPNLIPNATITDNAPVPDSVYIRDGKTLRRFSLPGYYKFTSSGTHAVKVIANNPTADGCPGTQEITYDIEVYDKPVTNFTFTHSGCPTDTAFFFDATTASGRPTIKWAWEFGDNTTDTVRNPRKLYSAAGTYNVKLTSITDIGCIGDTTKPITITLPPIAKFGVSANTCVNNSITFTDSSSITTGTIVKWNWNFGNGNVISNTTNASVTQTYSTPGTYIVTLQVENNAGCKSLIFSKTITIYPRPIADFTMPGVCLPSGSAQFTNLSTINDGTGSSMTYLWNFGDGGTDTAKNPVHVYLTGGPFNVTLQVTSVNDCFKDSTKTFSNIFAQPHADFTGPVEICLSDSAQFNDASTASNSTVTQWFWDFGDGTTSNLKNPKKKYSVSGTYVVKLYIKSAASCVSDTATKSILISLAPLAKFGITVPYCAGKTVTFNDSSTTANGNLIKWTWDFGDGANATYTNGNPFTHIYNASGNYMVTLIVEANNGCKSDTLKKTIIINPLPVANFAIPSAVCLPSGTAQFTSLSTISDGTQSGFTYLWDFGDGGSSTLQNPVHQYASGGPFIVKLTVTSVNGCVKDTSKQVTTILPQPKANFSFSTEVCLRDTSIFTDQSNGQGSSVVKWRWDFGDGATDTVQNPRHKYAAPGTYSVKLFIYTDRGCISDTMVKTTIVNPLPAPGFITSVPTCANQQIIITDQSAPNAGVLNQWFWDFGDGTNATYTNSNPFPKTYALTGIYNIKLSVKTDKGCKGDTTVKPVVISPVPVVNFLLPKICLNDAFAQFTDSSYIVDGSEAGFTFLWNFGDANANAGNPNTSTQKNPQHRYTAAGVYTVTLTVTSNKGCSAIFSKQFTVNGAVPLANFNVLNSGGLCSNVRVDIENTSTVDFGSLTKLEIIWDASGAPGVIVTDNSPVINKIYSHQYPVLQTTVIYQVKVRAYSGGSCVNEKTVNVTVNATPIVTFARMPGICLEANIRQITEASGSGVPGNGVFIGIGVSPAGVFNPATAGAGTFLIKYEFTSYAAGCKDSGSQFITVWPSPIAKWGYSAPTCEGAPITFTDSSVANFSNINQWRWNFGDATNSVRSNASPFTKTYAGTGNYFATLQVFTDSGCQSLVTGKTIIAHPLPVVNFSLPAAVCLPDGRAQFNDISGIADGTQSQFTYLWNFGDPNDPTTSTLKAPIHRYSSTGPFTVTLTVTSVNGCTTSGTKQLTNVFPQPKADFVAAPAEACLGGNFVFTDRSVSTSNIISWSWNLGDGTTAITPSTSRTYTNAGTFNVSLFVTNQQGCNSDTVVKPVIVHPYPIVNAGADLVVLEGGSVVIIPTVTGNDLTFRWTPSTYLSSDTAQRPTSRPTADINYKLTVTARGGCTASDDVFVKLLKTPGIPNTFSPNRDGINDKWIIQYLETYPGAVVEVYNRHGQIVYSSIGYNKPWDGTFKGEPLPVGVYYYIINPKNGRKQLTGSLTILR